MFDNKINIVKTILNSIASRHGILQELDTKAKVEFEIIMNSQDYLNGMNVMMSKLWENMIMILRKLMKILDLNYY